MEFGIKTLDEAYVENKTVLCRVDLNQPLDKRTGELKSTARIEASVPTIRELADRGAKVVLLAHQGSDIEYKNFYTTEPHGKVLSKLLGRTVKFIDDLWGPGAREAIKSLKPGEILLLDNVRFCSEEQTLFETKVRLTQEEQVHTQLVQKLYPLADLYVCDAFAASHRDQPSLCAFELVLPSYMGRLFQKEYSVISKLMKSPERPCVYVLGGAKVEDAFMMMGNALEKASSDRILTGGLVSNIFLASMGLDIGKETLEFLKSKNLWPLLEKAEKLLEKHRDLIELPTDLAWEDSGKRHEAKVGQIPEKALVTDIGQDTARRYENLILEAKTVFVNGPMGVFEREESSSGSEAVWKALSKTKGYTVVGGGDSVTAAKKFDVAEKIDYICTGGGALIRFLTGEELPVVRALRNSVSVRRDGL